MDEIIYRVYIEDWSTVMTRKMQYLADLQGGKDLKSLRHRVNNDTLEGLAADMAEEVFRFHYVGRKESQEVGFAFDLPYWFKGGPGGTIKHPIRLCQGKEEEFTTRFREAYVQQMRQLNRQQELRQMGVIR